MPQDEYTLYFGDPEATHDFDLHTFTWYDDGHPIARIVFNQVGERSGELKAEVSVFDLMQRTDRPIVGPRDVNLLKGGGGASGLGSLMKEAEQRSQGPDWSGAIQDATYATIHAFRSGYEGTRLGQDPDRKFEAPFLIEPWVASSGTTLIYGEGGLAKSTLALAQAIEIASGAPIFGNPPKVAGPVVYFDYEDDEEIHDARMLAMCRHLGIDPRSIEVYHYPLTAKVINSVPSMKLRVREHGAVAFFLDSVGMGRGGDAASAEDTIRLFRSLRSLRLPNVAVDHMSRDSKEKKDLGVDAFGSVYTMNSVRLAWALKRAQGPQHGTIYLSAHNRKANHVERIQDRGIEVRIESDGGIPKFIEVSTTDALRAFGNQSVTVRDRLASRLIGEADGLDYNTLATELGISRASVETALRRDAEGDGWFERIQGSSPILVRLNDWDTLQMWAKSPKDEA